LEKTDAKAAQAKTLIFPAIDKAVSVQTFRVLVTNHGTTTKLLHIQADNLDSAQLQARELNGILLQKTPAPLRAGATYRSGLKAQSIDELIFCSQLKSLVAAGLTLQESIDALQMSSSSKASSLLSKIIKENLAKGLPLSSCLAIASNSVLGLSPLLISMTKASEETSELAQALTRYATYAQQVDVVKQKIKSALIYPTFLLAVGGVVILFLLLFVVPRFAGIYDSVRVDLPLAARMLLTWGQWVKTHGLALLFSGGLFVTLILWLVTQPAVKRKVIDYFLNLAKLKDIVTSIQLARFYRTLAMLLAGGVALKPALVQLASGAKSGLAKSIHQVLVALDEGKTLTASLETQGLFISVGKSLISAGEASGNLATMLTEAAVFIEEESFRKVDKWMRLLEPGLMTILGLIIGLIVVLMYMPIFELAGSLQ
jgi:general secretion pathway protein F